MDLVAASLVLWGLDVCCISGLEQKYNYSGGFIRQQKQLIKQRNQEHAKEDDKDTVARNATIPKDIEVANGVKRKDSRRPKAAERPPKQIITETSVDDDANTNTNTNTNTNNDDTGSSSHMKPSSRHSRRKSRTKPDTGSEASPRLLRSKKSSATPEDDSMTAAR